MKMVNLKQGTDTYENSDGEVKTRDEYPWGLHITLNDDVIKKLGMTVPKVGDELMVTAKAKVLSTSTREDGDESKSTVELQITDIGIGSEGEKPSAAMVLYGKEGE
ncbi:capsid staple protein [Pectobacterium sp. 21LCBS03]|uniref:capsid staple protein n=1 Tax=Pectobacterium sp. 21LCBS03 TaxID=2935858 RepID=UPI00200FF625|nr:hypothetical protein [Pectobacterium sp. 21LCBS03]UPY96261.1 hypothetical protein MYB54_06015 [Pectobacterium sp. 21LCBS03]